MLTIEVKLNGVVIAEAVVQNTADLADVSTYRARWSETAEPDLGIAPSAGAFVVEGHRRRQTVWVLVAKVTVAILGQLADRLDEKPRRARIWGQVGRDHE